MVIFLVTLTVFAMAMAAMAVGVIFSNRRLHGSCGGSGDDCVCEIEKRRACHAKNQMLAAVANRKALRGDYSVLVSSGVSPEAHSAPEL
jgi:hypothetical protein